MSLSSAESSIESSSSSSDESSIELSIDSSIESISEHSDSIVLIEPIKRDRDRLRKILSSTANFIFNTTDAINLVSSFTASRRKKIVELLEKDIFISINKRDVSTDDRIFSSRFVNEIKHSKTEKAFEKFRLVIQTFNDQNKILVLTSSLIIQRINQRLIICLVVTFCQSMKLYLRDIIQTYVQSRFNLNRDFYVQSFLELIKSMSILSECILKMIKSLYEVSETDNHWFKTYHDHHTDKLSMTQFTYNSCLLYIITKNTIISRIDMSMQIDDILILIDQSFAVVEKEAIHSVKIMIKTREQLISDNSLKFNDTRIERIESNDTIYFRQETHIQGIQLINSTESTITNARGKVRIKLILRDQYIAQRAREAYLVSICQSEAFFDLSHVDQLIEMSSDDINVLNKRLQWQIINQSRDLKYVRLNQKFLRLVIFIDSSFVNNSDLFSQTDYVICLTDATHANILHWSSIKWKKVIRSVLSAELFAMIHDLDVELILKSIFIKLLDKKILISLIVIIDSKSLYDCLIRLSITIEKRLIIDVMTLRQFYKRREITEMIWIHEVNNFVDFMIKKRILSTLKTMIDINKIKLNTTE